METITIILAGITIKADGNDKVYFMADWAVCDAMVDTGFFRSAHLGPSTYGHMDYFLTQQAIDAAELRPRKPSLMSRNVAAQGGFHG